MSRRTAANLYSCKGFVANYIPDPLLSSPISLHFARVARSLVALFCLVALPRLTAAQADPADTTFMGVRPASQVAPLSLREPAVLRAPGSGHPGSRLPCGPWPGTAPSAAALDSARMERAAALRNLTLYGQAIRDSGADSTGPRVSERGVLGLSPKYADLALDGQVRLELRTDRLRNERCSPALLLDPNSGCSGGFKPPQTRQPGEPQIRRHHRAAGAHQRRLRHRARFHRQQQHSSLLPGTRRRDHPPDRGRYRHLPASPVPIHHRGDSGQ